MASNGTGGQAGADHLSPAMRRRLQECFAQGSLRLSQENYDYAAELFQQCVTGDPSNVAYLQSFLGALKRKYNDNKKGSALAGIKGARHLGAVKRAQKEKDWHGVIRAGVEMLRLNPWHVPTLAAMAEACKNLGYTDTQLVYLKMAQEANPNDPDVNRMCAKALAELGQYDQAIACWHRVERARPGDEEAAQAIAALTVEKTIATAGLDGRRPAAKTPAKPTPAQTQEVPTPEQQEDELKKYVEKHPEDVQKSIQLAEHYVSEDKFDEAEAVLAKCVEKTGDPEAKERLLDTQLRRIRMQYQQLEDKLKQQEDEQTRQQLQQVYRQLLEKEVEVYGQRVERFPNNMQLRFDFGLRLKAAGKYNEAIAEFQKARNDSRFRGACMLELGECFQHIKQYRLAMNHYEQAIQEIPERDLDRRKLALYRAGRLALGLRDLEKADKYLTELAGLDFNFRDLPRLLDKLAQLREQQGGPQPEE